MKREEKMCHVFKYLLLLDFINFFIFIMKVKKERERENYRVESNTAILKSTLFLIIHVTNYHHFC